MSSFESVYIAVVAFRRVDKLVIFVQNRPLMRIQKQRNDAKNDDLRSNCVATKKQKFEINTISYREKFGADFQCDEKTFSQATKRKKSHIFV